MKNLVKLTWLDTAHCDSDLTLEEAMGQRVMRMETYGLLLLKNDLKVVIGSTKTDDGYRDVCSIPRACIIKIEEVKQ